MDWVHNGRWSRDDRAESIHHYVPIDVPAGAEAVEVQLEYDRSAGVLDLGCVGAAGFRGWSGGARDRFVIRADAATPGYLPGAPEEGLWQVVLGLHRVAEAGLPYTVRARVGSFRPDPVAPDPVAPPRPPRRELPAPPGMRWLAGDLHAHTVHSDGSLTVAELAAAAVEQGLDFLAVTDHNTTSHHRELAAVGEHYGITLLPGQEVTTDTGHANAFGEIGWIDFREPAASWVSAVAARGGLL
ncbi:MAG TPA: CehA/McbA family metallohydrolase, partial [Mycobacteriales bacterium]|nr:CehA/McbA family metallohydrolase [Mycobacteriales bacterium]